MYQGQTKKGQRWLINRYSKEEAQRMLAAENFERKTISFYKYVNLGDEQKVRDLRERLFVLWDDLGCLGRIYIAQEGINAQMSVPVHQWETFVEKLYEIDFFNNVPLKIGVEQGASFWKLNVRIKEQIVADGLSIEDYDITNVGTHLDADSFNKAMEDPDAIVVDMRNEYESNIGHFRNAVKPKVETFREELPYVAKELSDKKDSKLLLYCTGGIRCEKASAYLKSKGFNNVSQLYGGIISYKHETQEKGLPNNFLGSNYVFDGRTTEKISKEIISSCDDCDNPCDSYINCAWNQCNKLFLQCIECREKSNQTCSSKCRELKAKQK